MLSRMLPIDLELTHKNATLSGRLFRDLIADERAGKFGGQTVQLVPHLTGAIKHAIRQAAEGDVHIVEIALFIHVLSSVVNVIMSAPFSYLL